MLFHCARHTIPAALSMLPSRMDGRRAHAMLLAIGLQESNAFDARRQYAGGPARGFWQFERAGIRGVMTHPSAAPYLPAVLRTLRYPGTEDALYGAIEHNDVLACALARLLLWTLPEALPDEHGEAMGWGQYLRAWRPGKPHPETWRGHYGVAWELVKS